ncbi:hypothetical protein MRB53_038787 [Persea americana]|nr:hypothetical protein MRB53_038787 [Persea americana]
MCIAAGCRRWRDIERKSPRGQRTRPETTRSLLLRLERREMLSCSLALHGVHRHKSGSRCSAFSSENI